MKKVLSVILMGAFVGFLFWAYDASFGEGAREQATRRLQKGGFIGGR